MRYSNVTLWVPRLGIILLLGASTCAEEQSVIRTPEPSSTYSEECNRELHRMFESYFLCLRHSSEEDCKPLTSQAKTPSCPERPHQGQQGGLSQEQSRPTDIASSTARSHMTEQGQSTAACTPGESRTCSEELRVRGESTSCSVTGSSICLSDGRGWSACRGSCSTTRYFTKTLTCCGLNGYRSNCYANCSQRITLYVSGFETHQNVDATAQTPSCINPYNVCGY